MSVLSGGNNDGPGNPDIPQNNNRSFDGSDRNDGLGSTQTPLVRMAAELSYTDDEGDEIFEGPNPRTISNLVARQGSSSVLSSARLTDLFWQFGQFLDQ